MAGKKLPVTLTGEVAELRRQVARLRVAAAAAGYDSTADPVIIGDSASSTGTVGEGDVSVGRAAQSIGSGAIAIGNVPIAWGQGAIAIGAQSDVRSGDYGVAIGWNQIAHGNNGVAVGHSSHGSTGAKADGATALGFDANAAHLNATALGTGATTNRAHQIMLGTSAEVPEIPGSGNGIALYAPNGTRYVLSVSNAGALVITATP